MIRLPWTERTLELKLEELSNEIRGVGLYIRGPKGNAFFKRPASGIMPHLLVKAGLRPDTYFKTLELDPVIPEKIRIQQSVK